MRTIAEILTQANIAKQRITEIYTMLTNEVSSDADLSGLTTISKTGIYKLWLYVFSALSYIQENLWTEAKTEMQSIVDNAIPGTDRWLAKEIVKFQYGDSLTFDDETGDYSYATINEAKQIIDRVAVVSGNGTTSVKVAKAGPAALSAAELNALKSYVSEIQYAGSNIVTISLASDKVKLPITVYYNAITPLATIQTNVKAAINAYLSELNFNGEFYLSRLVDAIQAVENIEDVVLGTVEGRTDAGSFNTISRTYQPVSGYLEVDPLFELDDTITYVVNG